VVICSLISRFFNTIKYGGSKNNAKWGSFGMVQTGKHPTGASSTFSKGV
jgi:hypothetical protein